MQVKLSKEAQADANAAIDWYIGVGAFIAASDFTDELDQALNHLNQFSELGKPSAYNTRTFPFHSFPYSLIYRLQHDMVRIIAIAHHSRRPRYWARRR